MPKKSKTRRKTHSVVSASTKPKAGSAFRYFGLSADPFTTLALQQHNLGYFIGREELVDRLSNAMFSLSNIGIAGDPGVGKSSLMQLLYERVGKEYFRIRIGVPVGESTYFLTELLRELLVTVTRVPGVNLKECGRRLQGEALTKNALLLIVKSIITRSKKPFIIFADDLEKIRHDSIRHLTRSDHTLQVLEELKPLFEFPNAVFVVALQQEFYSRVSLVVREGAEPTVLGLFKDIVLVEPFSKAELRRALEARLRCSGYHGSISDFLEPEALTLALAMAEGNPRRFLYFLSGALYHAFARGGKRLEFEDLFKTINEHLKLDLTYKKLLYFMAKAGRVMAANSDLQAFMGLDAISISRRLEFLEKNRLAEMVDVAQGARVFGLFGSKLTVVDNRPGSKTRIGKSNTGEKMFLLGDGGDV